MQTSISDNTVNSDSTAHSEAAAPSGPVSRRTPSLRVACVSDAAKLADIVHLAYRGGFSPVAWKNENHLVSGPRATEEEIVDIVQSTDKIVLVAEMAVSGDELSMVGCVQIENYGHGEAHIGLLTVSPNCQNLGLGKFLVRAAEEHAHKHWQCKTATMSVLHNRTELLDWYLRLGYRQTGETAPFAGVGTGVTVHFENPYFVIISKSIG
jgi:ribosomal protein S18 acetylase RimI-like enzyme